MTVPLHETTLPTPPSSESRHAIDVVVPAIALLLPLVYSNLLHHSFFAPKMALVLLLAGIGVPLLAGPALGALERGLALAFLAWAGLSVLVNDEAGLSLWGHANWGNGWLFMAGLVGAWASARHLGEVGRRRLRSAIVGAALVTVAISALESIFDLRSAGLVLVGGRPIGLLGNPVHVGGLVAATLALLASRTMRAPWLLAAAAALGLGLGLSGSRAGVAAAFLAAIGLTLHSGWRRALVLVLVFTIGLACAPLVAAGGSSVSARLSGDGALNASARPEAWREAGKAIRESPILGAGPGRFMEATSQFRTVRHAALGADRYFIDAHNLPLEYATTVGVVGLAIFVGWIATTAWRARGPFLWFAAALVPFALLQPQTAGLTPLAFLALGAAGPRAPVRDIPKGLSRLAVGVSTVALVAGVGLILGSRAAFLTRTEFRHDDARRALRLLPPWPEAALYRADPYAFRSSPSQPSIVDAGIRWYRVAAERDPRAAVNWVRLGDYQINFGRLDDAEQSYERALQADPVSLRAMKGLGLVAGNRRDLARARMWFERVLEIRPSDRLAREQVTAIERAQREEAGP